MRLHRVFRTRLTPTPTPRHAKGASARCAALRRGVARMTSFAHQAAQIDTAALARYLEARLPGFRGPIDGREDADRAVEPDLPARRAQRPLRAAQEAAGPAAEERPRGRPRVPRHEGAARAPTCRCRACCTCARTTASSAPRSSSWSSSTARCSGTRRCRSSTMPSAPRSTTSRTGRWPRCTSVDPAKVGPRRLRQGRAATSPASATAGPSSTAPRRPSTSRTWRR